MSAKSRNPKKNPAARRRRGRDVSGLPRARFRLDDIARLLLNAPAEVLPLMALPAVWLWNAAEDRHAAAHCVDCCVTIQYALAEYGIASEIQAVGVGIATGQGEPQLYGGGDGLRPHYNQDGTFNGHTILVIPAAGRLLDPTIQQFAQVPRMVQAALPVMGPLPVPGGLGTAPIGVDRTDHFVLYVPLPAPYRNAWQNSPVLAQRADEYREAGANLAAKCSTSCGGKDSATGQPTPPTRGYGPSSSLWTARQLSPTSAGTGSLTLPPAGNFASPTFPEPGACIPPG